MRNSILYILLIFFLLSCNKKNKELIIKGEVYSNNTNTGVQGVKVVLSGKIIESGKWTNTFSKLAEATTDNMGNYNITTDATRVSEYKIYFEKQNYISETKLLSPEDITTDKDNVINYTLYVKSFISINVKNSYPSNTNDYMSLKLSGEFRTCENCCTNDKFEFSGININQKIFCISPANKNIILNWDVLKNGSANSYSDTLLLTENDTTFYNINY